MLIARRGNPILSYATGEALHLEFTADPVCQWFGHHLQNRWTVQRRVQTLTSAALPVAFNCILYFDASVILRQFTTAESNHCFTWNRHLDL